MLSELEMLTKRSKALRTGRGGFLPDTKAKASVVAQKGKAFAESCTYCRAAATQLPCFRSLAFIFLIREIEIKIILQRVVWNGYVKINTVSST